FPSSVSAVSDQDIGLAVFTVKDDRIADKRVAVDKELHATYRNCAVAIVNRDGPMLALEDGKEILLPGMAQIAVGIGPVGARIRTPCPGPAGDPSGWILDRAVPDRDIGANDQIDLLVGISELNRIVIPTGAVSDSKPIIAAKALAGIVDDAIDAATETCSRGDVDDAAIERDMAVDEEQARASVRSIQGHINDRPFL